MLNLKATITGDKALAAKLQRLSTQGASRAMRKALRPGMNYLVKEVQNQIPNATTDGHDNNNIRKVVGTRLTSKRGEGLVGAKVGFNVGKTKGWAQAKKALAPGTNRRKAFAKHRSAQGTPHAHLLALGTKNRRTKRGVNRGQVKPGGFVPKAAAAASSTVGTMIVNKLLEQIEIEAKK